jgi:hypothetical protein
MTFALGCKEDILPPVVFTSPIIFVGPTSISSGGSITSEGGASVNARGVCWSTFANPTVSESKTMDGAGGGYFQKQHIRANPKHKLLFKSICNEFGRHSYGEEFQFIMPLVPTVSISPITNITATTANSTITIVSDGGASITTQGLCWSTLPNPSIRILKLQIHMAK